MSATTYILTGWLIDGSGGPIQEKMLLKIVDGRFTAIEQYKPETVPESFGITDLSHCTIMPPLVDSHAHLFMSGTIDKRIRDWQLVAGYDELRPVIGRHLHYLFSHGVLAVRDGGDRGGFALRYRSEKEMHKGIVLKVAGRAWHQKGRYGTLIGRHPGENEKLAEAYGEENDVVDQVKLVNSGLNSLKIFGRETPPQFSREEIAEVVAAAEQQDRKVMVHANGRQPVRLAVEGGCHSIEHGFFMGRENFELMAEKGTFWVPTLFTMKAYGANINYAQAGADPQVIEKNLNHQLEQLAMARELGVKVALGTDAGSLGVLHGESMAEEMKLYKKAGYSLAETVQCATSNGARLLGIDDFGLLEVGKTATFLVTRGAPAQLPRKLSYLEAIYLSGVPSELYRKNPVKYVAS
ncbi:MAG: amidohydrolase family protein [Desulfobulbaceae bacterium]|nr:amidohydrolase family protein [Desulfobulbaceae bacterium]